MTNENLLKYFECRPGIKEVYLVGSVVFTDKTLSDKYAKQVEGKVETKTKKATQDAYEKEKLNIGSGTPELTKEEAQEQLKVLVLDENTDVRKMEVLVEALGLSPTEDLRVALSEAKGFLVTNDTISVESAEDGNEGSEELTKEETETRLMGMELNEGCDYYELQDIVQALGLLTEGKSKDAYLAALINFKAEKANTSEEE